MSGASERNSKIPPVGARSKVERLRIAGKEKVAINFSSLRVFEI
jgi:hypothetical protein